MNIRAFANTVMHKAIDVLTLQLFITLASLPVLVAWGLPFSWLSIAGNVIFSPMLTLFLCLASLIFFAQLLYIPHQWLVICLEYITRWWSYAVSFGSTRCLIGFDSSTLIVLSIVSFVSFIVVMHKKLRTQRLRCAALALLCAVTMVYAKITALCASPMMHEISCNRGTITVVQQQNGLAIIEPGYLGQRLSAASFIEYTFLPALFKTYGTAAIEHLIIMQPSVLTLEAITRLCQLTRIAHIYLPYWEGENPRALLCAYGKLKRAADNHSTVIHRIGKKKLTLTDTQASITVTPCMQQLAYKTIIFPALQAAVDNHVITSAKYHS